MKINNDYITFKTSGKKYYANCGIIGLSEPGEDGWQVSGGYDDAFGGCCSEKLSKKEKIELADYMINLWTRFRKDHE
jgi:hypothetical protein